VRLIQRAFTAFLVTAGIGLIGAGLYTARGSRVMTAEFATPTQQVPTNSNQDSPVARFVQKENDAPLTVELIDVTPDRNAADPDRLSVSVGGEEHDHDLIVGDDIPISEVAYRVEDVRTWRGLLGVADGTPMAIISLFDAGNLVVQDLTLSIGRRVDVGSRLSLELRPCSNRDDALDRLTEEKKRATGRWGIVDADSVIWFETFAPGTGATLSDGSLVMLESFRADPPRLVVRKRSASGDERLELDRPSTEPPLLLELPGQTAERIALFVCEDGRIVLGTDPPLDLVTGETSPLPDGTHSLRLEQALRSAALATSQDTPFFEAVLESRDRRIRVRQGEAVRVGDALVRYLRRPDNTTAVFHLRINSSEGGVQLVNLRPGEQYSFSWAERMWLLRHADISPGDRVSIRRTDTSRVLWILGIGAIVCSLILIGSARRRLARN
jgi:hypothetical protein